MLKAVLGPDYMVRAMSFWNASCKDVKQSWHDGCGVSIDYQPWELASSAAAR